MCAIFGVWHARKAAELCVVGLHAQQHRAVDFAGIASTDGVHIYRERGEGIARKVFGSTAILDRLHGKAALGQTRYPTVAMIQRAITHSPSSGPFSEVCASHLRTMAISPMCAN